MKTKKLLCVLLAFVFWAFSACSEEAPDGSVNTVFFPFFEKDALDGYQYVLYPEKSGLLLSAYSDSAEIAVTVEQDEAADAEAFLSGYIKGMERYATLTNDPEIVPLETGFVKARISYRHNKATDEADVYATDAFASKLDNDMYLLIVFNSWLSETENDLLDAEKRFFDSFRLENREVSDVYLAQIKNARSDEEGNQYVSVDFCSVVYDASIFTVYAQNEKKETAEYSLSEDALIWSYDPEAALYTQTLTEPTAENLVEVSALYYENMGFDIIFQILFDANNEIVWMMHYNAF